MQTVLIGFNIIDKCGFYSDHFRDMIGKAKLDKTWPNFKVHFARDFKETRDSNNIARNSGYVNIVSQMQNEMQTIANENVQALAHDANKPAADTNAIKNPKDQIIEMKAARTDANPKKKLTCQVIDTRKYYSRNNN